MQLFFSSGEQVSPCCEAVGFQSQDFLLRLQNQPFSWAFIALTVSFLTGSVDTEVIQSPGHLVKGKGQKAKMDCVPIKGHINVYSYRKKPEGAFEFLIYLKNQDINCGRYRSISTAIFGSVSPKLTLQPGNQLHRGSGLSSVFLCQQPVHSASCQLFLEHKLTMDPAQEISGVVGG